MLSLAGSLGSGHSIHRREETGIQAYRSRDSLSGLRRSSFRLVLVFAGLSLLLLAAACGGEEEEAVDPPEVTTPDAGTPESEPGGTTVETGTQAEGIVDTPLALDEDLPIPPDFRAAYGREAPIAVQFYKEDEGAFYPQGLGVDQTVDGAVRALQSEYPQVEFFIYDIDEPGEGQTTEQLQRGEYGTLAAQLGVGYTPYVALLAPRGEEYYYENVFQGYVPQEVLDQALFDVSGAATGDDAAGGGVILERAELSADGNALEYVTIGNLGADVASLEGYSLNVLDPETGEVVPGPGGLPIQGSPQVEPEGQVVIGANPGVVDEDGEPVDSTFGGDGDLNLAPGDQISLLDDTGAVAATLAI
ncbi:MAG: hypothetical protein H0V53_11800 [Rubrobacter sp.]|nr:hypothetical protein [Rubrobacter sp.]